MGENAKGFMGMLISRSFYAIGSWLVAGLLVMSLTSQVAAQTPGEETNQVALFVQQQEELAAEGREIVSAFLAGDSDAFLARSSPKIQADLENVPLDALLIELQTNRISMDFAGGRAHFDGRFNGTSSISGFYHDFDFGVFTLTAEETQGGAVPVGRWNGLIYPDQVEISVNFSGSADALTATIDVPSQDIVNAPLTNVTFAPEQPIGEIVDEQALPLSSVNRSYTAVLEWGPGYLVVSTVLDNSGTLIGFRYTALWLPPREPEAVDYQSEADYRLPTDGQVVVYHGGENELAHFHNDAPAQRYGYEFAVWRDGSTFAGDGSRNEDYFIWGMPVVAPASGTVVAVENGMPDLEPGQTSANQDNATSAGNHVAIQTAEGEWVFVAHLQQGSVSVKVGDEVQAGQTLALVGHSGTAPEPLLHIHTQSSADIDAPAEAALPTMFSNYVVGSVNTVTEGIPSQGQFVNPNEGEGG